MLFNRCQRFGWVLSLALILSTPAAAEFAIQLDATWMTNGFVRAVIRSGDTIYIGRKFTSVRPCAPVTTGVRRVCDEQCRCFRRQHGRSDSVVRPAVTSETGRSSTCWPCSTESTLLVASSQR